MKDKINQEIEKTLQALDDVQAVDANPYLLTRINAKITSTVANNTYGIPFFRIAIMMLFLTNLFAGIVAYKSYNTKTDITEIFAQEFNLRYQGNLLNE